MRITNTVSCFGLFITAGICWPRLFDGSYTTTTYLTPQPFATYSPFSSIIVTGVQPSPTVVTETQVIESFPPPSFPTTTIYYSSGYSSILPTSQASMFPLTQYLSRNISLAYWPKQNSTDACEIQSFCATRSPGIYCYRSSRPINPACPCLVQDCWSIVMVACPFGIILRCEDGFLCDDGSKAWIMDTNVISSLTTRSNATYPICRAIDEDAYALSSMQPACPATDYELNNTISTGWADQLSLVTTQTSTLTITTCPAPDVPTCSSESTFSAPTTTSYTTTFSIPTRAIISAEFEPTLSYILPSTSENCSECAESIMSQAACSLETTTVQTMVIVTTTEACTLAESSIGSGTVASFETNFNNSPLPLTVNLPTQTSFLASASTPPPLSAAGQSTISNSELPTSSNEVTSSSMVIMTFSAIPYTETNLGVPLVPIEKVLGESASISLASEIGPTVSLASEIGPTGSLAETLITPVPNVLPNSLSSNDKDKYTESYAIRTNY